MGLGSGLFSNQRAQRPHLVRGGGGLAGEVADLRSDVSDEMDAMAAIAVEEFIDVAVADVDAIVVALAPDDTAAVTLSGAALDGVVGAGVMDPPRNITFDTLGATPADVPATGTVTGKDVNGDELIEVINLSQIVGQAVGLSAFAEVDSIDYPIADGTDATVSVGFGDVIGLAKPLKSRAGAEAVVMEIEAGTVLAADAITGTFVDAATSAPNGTYEPATAPDDANDYAVYYEWDPTA